MSTWLKTGTVMKYWLKVLEYGFNGKGDFYVELDKIDNTEVSIWDLIELDSEKQSWANGTE
jgi:hypothetical protein